MATKVARRENKNMKNIINFLVGIMLTLIFDVLFTAIVLCTIHFSGSFDSWTFDNYFNAGIIVLCIGGLIGSGIVRDIFKEEY